MQNTVISIGDVHLPWAHRGALAWVVSMVEAVKPDIVIQVGDLNDFYTFSRYTRTHDFITPKQERKRARKMGVEFWDRLKKASPTSKMFQLLGNHDERLQKRALDKMPEFDDAAQQWARELFTFDGVETLYDSREELFIDDVCYQHGFRSKLGDHARYNQMSTVCGHSHVGGVVFYRNRKGIYYEMNCGWIGNERAHPFAYGPQKVLGNWTRGLGMIDHSGPRFIPAPR